MDILDDADRMLSPRPSAAELEKLNSADWTVLNVDFGIPLFDSSLNAEVCERITSMQLWHRDKLDSLMSVQRSLSERLLDFIREHVDAPADGKVTLDVVLPTKNLLFVDGKLRSWSGK